MQHRRQLSPSLEQMCLGGRLGAVQDSPRSPAPDGPRSRRARRPPAAVGAASSGHGSDRCRAMKPAVAARPADAGSPGGDPVVPSVSRYGSPRGGPKPQAVRTARPSSSARGAARTPAAQHPRLLACHAGSDRRFGQLIGIRCGTATCIRRPRPCPAPASSSPTPPGECRPGLLSRQAPCR